jgi:hypothetical protein
MTDRLYVRCCCQPTKILGTLPAPVGNARSRRFQYAELTNDGPVSRHIELEIAKFATFTPLPGKFEFDPLSASGLSPRNTSLTHERAYKAEGVTLEDLKKIAEFVEYDGAQI